MELKRTKFTEEFMMVNVIQNTINIKDDYGFEEKQIYTVIGIDLLGNRRILEIKIENNDSRFFLDIFEKLKGKGIKNIYYAVALKTDTLTKGLKISYPNAVFIDSLTMNIIKLWNWVTCRGKYSMIKKIKDFYIQDSLEQATELITYFKENYKDNKLIISLINMCFNNVDIYYKYDKIVREFLFNHRSFTEIHYLIKSICKNNIYENYDDAKNDIRTIIKDIEKNRLYSKKEWLTIINHCDNYFKGLVEKVATQI